MAKLVCKTYDAKGKFGRILGDFEVYDSRKDCEISLIRTMIEDGYGVAYEGQSKDLIKEKHLANRKRLIEEGKVPNGWFKTKGVSNYGSSFR